MARAFPEVASPAARATFDFPIAKEAERTDAWRRRRGAGILRGYGGGVSEEEEESKVRRGR
jgi:hypothetical protein